MDRAPDLGKVEGVKCWAEMNIGNCDQTCLLDDELARGEENMENIAFEKPWNCAPDALSRYGMIFFAFQHCSISTHSCLFF
jgi:hypothetical protein